MYDLHTLSCRELFTPPLLVVVNPPVDVNTHTQTVLPPLRLCVLFKWCIRTQRRILGISLLDDPDVLSVSVCLASVCMIIRILRRCLITGRMPRSGKLSVLFLLTGQKSGFSHRRGDSLHRFGSNFAGPTGTWVRLAVRNFTSIGAGGWECGPQISKISTFW